MLKTMLASVFLTALLATPAFADSPGRDRFQDRRELRQGRAELRDDLRDLRTLQRFAQEWDWAVAQGRWEVIRELEWRLGPLVARELREGRRELRDDRREIRRDGREIRGGDDWREVRDDRRDRRDDVRDLRAEAWEQRQRVAIATELRDLAGRYEPAALYRKRELLGALIAIAAHEVRSDRRELREDRRELREDRRDYRDERPGYRDGRDERPGYRDGRPDFRDDGRDARSGPRPPRPRGW